MLSLCAAQADVAAYPHANANRPLTLPLKGLVVGAIVGSNFFTTENGIYRPSPRGDLIVQFGLHDRVQFTLPAVLTFSFGDRSASQSPEFAIFGGIHRLYIPRFLMMPTVGATMRRKVSDGAALRFDLEARGTTALRVGTMGGFGQASAAILYAPIDRLSFGFALTGRGRLTGPGPGGIDGEPLNPPSYGHAATVTFGSTDEVPLLRWSPFDRFDLDLIGEITPRQSGSEVRVAVGLRFPLFMDRPASAK